ncbi:MAG TPA: hypothetical protein VK174_02155 [Chitinophagales bacterium]|nr:hypothetical protein [Chitinophagales bacterium]
MIEIDGKTEASKKLLTSIRKLQKTDSSIKITHKKESFKPLTAKDMALPGGLNPTKEQLQEFLGREEGPKRYTLEEVREGVAKRLKKIKNK